MKLSYILESKQAPDRIVTIPYNATVQEAVDALCAHNTGAVIVVAPETGRMAGILTERDILRALCSASGIHDLRDVSVEAVMTRDVVCAALHEDARKVLATMTHLHIRHMPVMDGDRLVGVISHRDVIRELHKDTEHKFRSSCDYLGGTYGLKVY